MEKRKTADNIRSVFRNILQAFEAHRPENFFVTENGANVKAAFSDQSWLSCCGHNINLVVSHALDPKNIITETESTFRALANAANESNDRSSRRHSWTSRRSCFMM